MRIVELTILFFVCRRRNMYSLKIDRFFVDSINKNVFLQTHQIRWWRFDNVINIFKKYQRKKKRKTEKWRVIRRSLFRCGVCYIHNIMKKRKKKSISRRNSVANVQRWNTRNCTFYYYFMCWHRHHRTSVARYNTHTNARASASEEKKRWNIGTSVQASHIYHLLR